MKHLLFPAVSSECDSESDLERSNGDTIDDDSEIEESYDDAVHDTSFGFDVALDDAEFNGRMSISLRRHVAQLRLLEPESSKEAANSQCSFHEINLGFQPLGHGRNGVDRCNSVTSKKKRKKRSEYFCHKPVLLQTVLEIFFYAGAPKARHYGCFICSKSVGIG